MALVLVKYKQLISSRTPAICIEIEMVDPEVCHFPVGIARITRLNDIIIWDIGLCVPFF
jgi:hypothetical protein